MRCAMPETCPHGLLRVHARPASSAAPQIGVPYLLATAILYPWNARFISKLDLKDFHRVPEVAFLALAGMAYLAK